MSNGVRTRPVRARRVRWARAGIPVLVVLLLSACTAVDPGDGAVGPTRPETDATPAAGATPGDGTATPDDATPTDDPADDPTGPPGDAEDRGPAAVAVADLADRLGVPASEIAVVRVAEVTWRDAALGCPRPGMAYAQVLTDGTLVELEAEGSTYEYHSGGGRPPFLCESPEPPAG